MNAVWKKKNNKWISWLPFLFLGTWSPLNCGHKNKTYIYIFIYIYIHIYIYIYIYIYVCMYTYFCLQSYNILYLYLLSGNAPKYPSMVGSKPSSFESFSQHVHTIDPGSVFCGGNYGVLLTLHGAGWCLAVNPGLPSQDLTAWSIMFPTWWLTSNKS